MSWSFPLGRLFGTQIRVHATFFLLVAWIGWLGWLDGGPGAAAVSVLYIALLFGCVVAHEFGHALAARRYGIRTADVTLLPVGGLARLSYMPVQPGREIFVALAGPAVNVAIFLVLLALIGPGSIFTTTLDHLTLSALPAQLALVNLILAIFNLLPAFPMDGGRVLRALLAIRLARPRATRLAAAASQVLATLMAVAGIAWSSPVLLLVALFVFFAARAESARTRPR